MENKITEFARLFEKKKEYDLIEVWHYLMLNYGYIPFDDFLNMDATTKDKLVTLLNEMNKEMENKIEESKRGMKKK
jgi:hypothetical protein